MTVELPFIDEFDTMIDASPPLVFEAAARALGGGVEGPAARAFSRVLGCLHRGNSYTLPPIEGQEANGFRVASVSPPGRLVLEGQHRFAAYRLSFFIDPSTGRRSRLRARTDALFPGLLGASYRALVIGTGGHGLVVRRLLRAVSRRASRLQDEKLGPRG